MVLIKVCASFLSVDSCPATMLLLCDLRITISHWTMSGVFVSGRCWNQVGIQTRQLNLSRLILPAPLFYPPLPEFISYSNKQFVQDNLLGLFTCKQSLSSLYIWRTVVSVHVFICLPFTEAISRAVFEKLLIGYCIFLSLFLIHCSQSLYCSFQ